VKLAIVVIEDNRDAGDTHADWLGRWGTWYKWPKRCGGIDLVRTTCPNVVLRDISLPDMADAEVCCEVKCIAMIVPNARGWL
jgi:DNA-binding response OmpR family regulator